MPRLDWYAFYVADYRADTRHLKPMQHFAYREILDEIFLSGQHENPPSVPDDDDFLRGICKPDSDKQWAETRRVLIDGPRALLTSENGRLTQRRMAHEVEKALGRSGKGSHAANARWKAGEHGSAGDRASEGKRNGNGHEHLSRRQFAYLASRIQKWRDENGSLFVGGSIAEAFREQFGWTTAAWEAEVEWQNKSNA